MSITAYCIEIDIDNEGEDKKITMQNTRYITSAGQGDKGADGADGKDGADGADGKDGDPGKTIETKYAYYRSNSSTAPTSKPWANGWQQTPLGVTYDNRYEYVS